jgi:hypothetical protein
MNKRQRGRGRKQHNNNNPNRSLDSNGPDVKIRGSANTIYDKYTTLARDAASSGHRVKAENYLQHAEHYLRLVMEQQAKAAEKAEQQQQARQQQQSDNAGKESNTAEDDGQNQNNGRSRRYPARRRSQQNDGPAEEKSSNGAGDSVKAEQKTSEAGAKEKPIPRRKKKDVPVGETVSKEAVESAAE